ACEGVLTRQLTPGCVTETSPSPMTQAEFLWQHHQDTMAVEKLAEGIRLFAFDQVKLEQQIQQML
ncbi:transaldolase family protein, partial [Klebsiella pneumoniae]